MLYELSKQEQARLEKCLAAFNLYSGTNWSLQKYIQFMLSDAIAEHEQIARNARVTMARAVRHAH